MKILSSLKDIDIVNCNYITSHMRQSQDNCSKTIRIKRNIYMFFSFTAKQIIRDLICVFKNKNLKDKNILFYNSVNQYNALIPLYEKLGNSILVNISYKKNTRLPMAWGCLISILLAPHFYYQLNKKYKNEKTTILNDYVNYFFIEGMYFWWSFYLRIKKPKRIILSNDHVVWYRILRKAAQINNIPTVYLQHASVTEQFPKLDFDLSLLEGKDAFNKYSKKGYSGKVELVGMVKFDNYYSDINEHNKIQSIGICTNILDDEVYIEKLCSDINNSFKHLNIILRPHPRDKRYGFYQEMKDNYHVHLSDSTKVNSFEYLKKVDVNIAGETSMHLEAVLMNVYPIYFQFQESKVDHYGYLDNHLVTDIFDNTNELVNFLNKIKNNKPNIRYRAKYYVDTVNSEYDGKSTELALKHIKEFL